MKRPKDRLHRVLVVGATPAGIAATNKLGELGIPVTLVDPDPDLDAKLASEAWRLPSGVTLNLAHRSGLLRILRNPGIRCIVPGAVTAIKNTQQGFSARVKTIQTFVDPKQCILCGRCVEVCPVTTPDGSRPIVYNGRRSLPGRPWIDKRKTPLCRDGCPLGVNVQGYMALAGAGRFHEAFDLIVQDNVLPGICGRVCTHPCEAACRRGELDEPLSIRGIKRFLADYELAHPRGTAPPAPEPRSEQIAVIGSGPAGLAAAADLARFGFKVIVFEKEAHPGGLLRYGIGPFRLPRKILDADLAGIQKLGVVFKTGQAVDLRQDIPTLKKKFSAVVVTTGTWVDRKLGVPGEDLPGVDGCVQCLSGIYRDNVTTLTGKTAVIGDGNAAFDLARVLKRLGADVTMVSWFPEDRLPADPEEIQGAVEEGVALVCSARVTAFARNAGDRLSLACMPTRPGRPDADGICWPVVVKGGKPFELTFDRAVVAIGQAGPFFGDASSAGLAVNPAGFLKTGAAMETGTAGVFAAGDAVTGPSAVVRAMASGREAAASVFRHLTGRNLVPETRRPENRDFPEIGGDVLSRLRPNETMRQPRFRCDNFDEVALGLSQPQAIAEAGRCLQCGVCADCLQCEQTCSAIHALAHDEPARETREHAGVVIIADPDIAPAVKGDDVIRAYGPPTARPDVHAMLTRGFAAAAQAMILLSATSESPKGYGVPLTPPDPVLAREIRIGVFVCKCNGSLGWRSDMDAFVDGLTAETGVVHAEVINAACVPEGISNIIRSIRQKGMTRVVLASCVCCSLDFVCSACTDQRTRLKTGLFKGTGISRSMVETCNLRGEALRLLEKDPAAGLDHFTGLIRRSITRARKLRSQPSPPRTYNFTTAVIGRSPSAAQSALCLAQCGFDVFAFGVSRTLLTDLPEHPNIQTFPGQKVAAITGTLGAFQIFSSHGKVCGPSQVGVVIVDAEAAGLVPYIPQQGLARRDLDPAMQERGVPGRPFLLPGTTAVAGFFVSNPPGIPVSERQKGAAVAALAAAVMPRGPRQSKGHTVVVDQARCRGCGACFAVCPYQAVSFTPNAAGGWAAVVNEALCKGCGNCISVCPSNAADSPYRNQAYLERLLEEVLA